MQWKQDLPKRHPAERDDDAPLTLEHSRCCTVPRRAARQSTLLRFAHEQPRSARGRSNSESGPSVIFQVRRVNGREPTHRDGNACRHAVCAFNDGGGGISMRVALVSRNVALPQEPSCLRLFLRNDDHALCVDLPKREQCRYFIRERLLIGLRAKNPASASLLAFACQLAPCTRVGFAAREQAVPGASCAAFGSSSSRSRRAVAMRIAARLGTERAAALLVPRNSELRTDHRVSHSERRRVDLGERGRGSAGRSSSRRLDSSLRDEHVRRVRPEHARRASRCAGNRGQGR